MNSLLLVIFTTIIFCFYYYTGKCNPEFLQKNQSFSNSLEHIVYIDDSVKLWTPHLVKYLLNSIKKYKIVDNNANANILIYSILNSIYDKNKINIVISGEAHILDDKVDLSICSNFLQNSKYNIYYPQMYSSLFEHRKSINSKDYISNKTKFCAYMYSIGYEHREKIFKLVSEYKRVDSLGQNLKNTEITTTRDVNNENETYNDISIELYKEYKFVIAVENKDIDGYNTEKLINPLIANCIPIYWGNDKIFKYINKRRLIYIPDYTDQQLIEIIKKIDTNDMYYRQILNENWYVDESKTPLNIEKHIQKEIDEKIKVILSDFKV